MSHRYWAKFESQYIPLNSINSDPATNAMTHTTWQTSKAQLFDVEVRIKTCMMKKLSMRWLFLWFVLGSLSTLPSVGCHPILVYVLIRTLLCNGGIQTQQQDVDVGIELGHVQGQTEVQHACIQRKKCILDHPVLRVRIYFDCTFSFSRS